MNEWTSDELDRIGAAEELQLASLRRDGTLRPYVTMWVVRDIDAAYHSKYDRYGPRIVGSVVGPDAEAVTLEFVLKITSA